MPFSGHGGAGGCSEPTGANTCCCQYARCVCTSFCSVGMRIGLADAATAPNAITPATTTVTPTPRSKPLFMSVNPLFRPCQGVRWI